MPLTYTYTDGYIAAQVDPTREARAVADVAQLGTLPVTWVQRLVVLRAYVITCMECAKSPEDMWSTKLAFYRKEYDSTLPQARAAQAVIDAAANSNSASIFSVELFRA